jgi:mannosyltransferase OCH1-like enzyme
MLYGGVYLDADTECFRPMDYLVQPDVMGAARQAASAHSRR